MALRGLKLTVASLALGALALAAPVSAARASTDVMPAIHTMGILNGSNGNGPGGGASTTSNMYYHGGTSDGSGGTIGVETAPKVYLVFWGSQWKNDPSGEAVILQDFLLNVGGSLWNNTVTQYCQGSSVTFTCPAGSLNLVGNQTGMLAGSWYDKAGAAPKRPSQSALAAEAVNAASHFGNNTATLNASVQYVIATATGNNSSGFGSRYCAWHSSTTTSSSGDVAYTNLPYITDAGSSCGANFNNLGADAGITIVEGHEFAETETDQFPSTGWLDSSGSEIGDKCAWNSATTNESFGSLSFPVQPLWSNAANSGNGNCVMSS